MKDNLVIIYIQYIQITIQHIYLRLSLIILETYQNTKRGQFNTRFYVAWLSLSQCSLAFKDSILFGSKHTRWRLFQKRVVRTKFDIYVFIKSEDREQSDNNNLNNPSDQSM